MIDKEGIQKTISDNEIHLLYRCNYCLLYMVVVGDEENEIQLIEDLDLKFRQHLQSGC